MKKQTKIAFLPCSKGTRKFLAKIDQIPREFMVMKHTIPCPTWVKRTDGITVRYTGP